MNVPTSVPVADDKSPLVKPAFEEFPAEIDVDEVAVKA